MTDLVKVNPNVDGISAMRCVVVTQLLAGENLTAGEAVYIKGADSKVWKAVSTVKDTRTIETGTTDFSEDVAKFDGLVNSDYAVGEAVTIFGQGAIFGYGSGLTAGAFYYVSDTAGKLADARVATGDRAVCKAVSTTDILVLR